ncbi:hypothetical protein AB0K49_20310 [Streptomyces decoyicus]
MSASVPRSPGVRRGDLIREQIRGRAAEVKAAYVMVPARTVRA